MSNTIKLTLIGLGIFLLFSCLAENSNQSFNEKKMSSKSAHTDTVDNRFGEPFIFSLELRKIVDTPSPIEIIITIATGDLLIDCSKLNKTILYTNKDTLINNGSSFCRSDKNYTEIKLSNSSFLISLSDDELHTELKSARLKLKFQDQEYVIEKNADIAIETSITKTKIW